MAISSYLIWGLVLSGAGLALLPVLRPHSDLALLSGLLAAPLGLLDAVFVPEYWSPPHLIGAALSIEGVLFSFGNGVLIWLIAWAPFRNRLTFHVRIGALSLRLLICLALALIMILVTWKRAAGLINADIMTSVLLALVVSGAFILWHRRDAWKLMLTGILGFGIFYAAQLFVLSWADPDFAEVWAPAVRAGLRLFGFPVEEIAWAALYGGVWVTAMAWACDVRVAGAD